MCKLGFELFLFLGEGLVGFGQLQGLLLEGGDLGEVGLDGCSKLLLGGLQLGKGGLFGGLEVLFQLIDGLVELSDFVTLSLNFTL